jgi:hypothetical protein
MQRRSFGKALRYLVAVGTLLSSLVMFSCGGSDNTQAVSVAVPLTDATVAAVQAVPLTFSNGPVFSPAITGTVTLTFNSPNTFTLIGSAGTAATGVVTYGSPSCTFDVQIPGDLIPSAALLTVPTCNLLVSANNVGVGGTPVIGTVSLLLSGAAGTVNSTAVTAQVSLNGNSELFVENPATGVSVDMGVQL